MTEPIFLLSAQRTGSTLLQRILATHSQINTSPEPWLLLPMIYALKKEGVFAHYHHPYLARGVAEFCECLPEQKKTYFDAIRIFAESLYEKAAKGNRYFLDKTPAYDLVAREIVEIFPEAKIIVLLRNPVASLASSLKLWGQGKWRLFPSYDNLVTGLKNLLEVAIKYRDRICVVNFEDLTKKPEREVRRISDFLHLEFESEMVSGFKSVSFKGKMGDPTADRYSTISTAPQEKWKTTMNTPFRKAWVKRYLNYLGKENLAEFGYNTTEIIDELSALPNDVKKSINDIFEMPRDWIKIRLKKIIFKRTARYS